MGLGAAVSMIFAANPHVQAQSAGFSTLLASWDHDEHPDLRGVVVLRDGRSIGERYYNDATSDELHDIRSAGKSVTALLVGIAVDRGAIRSVDDPVVRYWPAAAGSAIGAVRLREVLTMRSGLAAFDDDPASPGNEDLMDESPDPLAFLRAVPRAGPPGARYVYNSVTAYAAGVVVAEATATKMGAFAGRRLFTPLGITRWRWDADASGVTKGQGNLWLTTRGMAAIGEMVRNGGRSHGHRVVSTRWIADMLAPKVNIAAEDPYADGYGYFWYRKDYRIADTGIAVSFASGNGGNKIYVVPGCRLVVAVTSSAYGRGYGQRRSEAILKAILAKEIAAGGCRTSSSLQRGAI
ncbi:serine hydrolase domain-containing protein [Sphingomonas psychrotolerans]|nr:serine hydrolase domain-containing protein [Sphingomonas psychrotolerans]